MKEELCYVAFNPATEEKVKQPDALYKLPDGQTVRVRKAPSTLLRSPAQGRWPCFFAETLRLQPVRASVFTVGVYMCRLVCYMVINRLQE